MKVLVYGAGVIGGQLVHALIKAGNDVTVIARGAWKETLRRDGLRIRHHIQKKDTVDYPLVLETPDNEHYYLYFGVYDYNTRKAQWRVYREVYGTSYDINYSSLHSSGWKRYRNYQSTSNLTSGQTYCYQIHAGRINASGYPIDKNYSSVRTMTYLHAPYLNYSMDGNQISFGGYTQGANNYQYRYKRESWNYYHYAETITPGYVSWIHEATPSDRCVYEARAILKTKSNGTAYSAWASIKLS